MRIEIAVGLWVLSCVTALVAAASEEPLAALGVCVVALLALVSAVAVRAIERRRRIPLTAIFFVALAARYGVAILIEYVIYAPSVLDRAGLFAPDELQYLYEARIYAEQLAGHAPPLAPDDLTNWTTAAPMRLAAFCFQMFGVVNIVPKLVICTLGAGTAVMSALIADEVFPGSGTRAGWYNALFPSLVLWTSMVIKDGIALFGVQLFLTAFVLRMGRTRLSIPLVVMLAIPGLAAIATSRSYEMGFLAIAVGGALAIGRGRNLVRNLGLYAVISFALVVFMQRYFKQPVDFSGDESPLAKVAAIRSGFAEGTGSAISHDIVDVRSPLGLLAWVPIGLAYFFFAPLPFTGTSIISAATSPEMIVWYLLLPSLWRGLGRAMRDRTAVFLALFLFAISSAIGWSILVTNVGTIYRFRAQIFFVPLLLIAYDQVARRRSTSSNPVAPQVDGSLTPELHPPRGSALK